MGYTGESSSSVKVTKDMKFVKANESIVATTNADQVKMEKKKNVFTFFFFHFYVAFIKELKIKN